jgi:hypothetical protein
MGSLNTLLSVLFSGYFFMEKYRSGFTKAIEFWTQLN